MTNHKTKILNDPNIDQNRFEVLSGWFPLIVEMTDKIYTYCDLNNVPRPFFVQIKQKMGGLRVYIKEYDAKIYNIVKEYEHLSLHTCEVTGEYGKGRNINGWYCVLSDVVAENLLKRSKDTGLSVSQILREEYDIGL